MGPARSFGLFGDDLLPRTRILKLPVQALPELCKGEQQETCLSVTDGCFPLNNKGVCLVLAQVGLVGALMDILKLVCCVLATSVRVSVIVDEVVVFT